ncbi:COG1470 family protein [Streptomyces sp. NPDC055709]
MSVRAELTVPEDVITPGESLTAHLRVWNESRIVDAYRLQLIGPPAKWPDAEADLGQLPVYPGNHEKINIPITLPRESGLGPGPLTFAVRVASVEDPAAVAVPEADIQVGEFHDAAIEAVRPRVSGALWSSNLVVLENTGNATATVRLRVAPEADDAPLRVSLRRSRLVLQPGEQARVSLLTRVLNPMFTGTAANWQVLVRIGQEHAEEGVTAFTHRQRPMLPKAVLKALTVAVGATIALVVLWISPVGGKKPKAETESAKGPSQVEAVQKKQRKQEEEKRREEEKAEKEEEKEKKDQEAADAPQKKDFQYSLVADTKTGTPVAEYTVPKGFRLSVKSVQLSAAGPATGMLFLKAAGVQLASFGVNDVKEVSLPPMLSPEEGEKLILQLDCPAPPPDAPSTDPSAPSSTSPTEPTTCTATGVIVGQLIPLTGPNAEEIKPKP